MTIKIQKPRFQKSVQYLCGFILTSAAFLTASTQAATCTYTVSNEWNTGFQGSITIANNGTTAINGWNVGWQYTSNKITSSWNATLSGTNPYTASSLDWNKTIQPGQSVSFGVQGDKNGSIAEKPVITGSVCSTTTSSTSSVASSASSIKNSVASSNSSSVISSAKSSSSSVKSSSSVASSVVSSVATGQQCNWYGTLYPLCNTTPSGWGYENNKSCIAAVTCSAQPAPYGIVGVSSSVSSVASSRSSASVASSVKSSSSSVVSSSIASSVISSVISSIKSSSSSSKSSSSSVASSTSGVVSLKALVDFPIGVAVGAGSESDSIINSSTATQQQAIAFQHFSQFTAGNIMKMSYLHPSETSYTFTQADELVAFAASHGIRIHAHTLIWHSDYQVPNFMKNYTGDFAAMLKTHVQTVTSHFAGKVDSWDVVNEALAEDGDGAAVNGFRNSVFYQKMGLDFIDQAFINARAADPAADLFYNDFNIENGGTKTTNLLALVDGMKTRGVPITGVGFQMHVLLDWPSASTIEAAMKAVADRGLKVKISELDVRVNNKYNSSAPVYTSLTPAAAALQKERYRQIVAAYVKVVPPAQRAGITVWGIWDADSWLNTASEPDWPLLFDINFLPKPALQGFANGLTGSNQ